MRTHKSLLRRILTACGILAFLAAVAYGIYYFFFAEDEDELDGDFFDEAEEAVEEAAENAADAVADAAEAVADAVSDIKDEVEFATP